MLKDNTALKITITKEEAANNKTVAAQYKENILNICQNHHIKLESYCGGALECLSCIIYVADIKSISTLGKKEQQLLQLNNHRFAKSSPYKNWHKRFACQCKIKRDCSVIIPKNDEMKIFEI